MVAILFDTLKFSDTLQRTFTSEQARTLTDALVDAMQDQLVTKSDIAQLEERLGARFKEAELRVSLLEQNLRAEIRNVRTETQSMDSSIRADMKNEFSILRTEIPKWIVGALAFNVFAVAGPLIAVAKVFAR